MTHGPATSWTICEPDVAAARKRFGAPLESLARGEIPAIVLRNAWSRAHCRALVERFIAEDLLFDPRQPVPERFKAVSIPEGHYQEGSKGGAQSAWEDGKSADHTRIDIGTSLGYRGADKEAFLAHSAQTHALFERLFGDGADPVATLYDALQALSANQLVTTAVEPDGRPYGPAIFRAHYGGYTYRPHFDSVRLREKRTDYAVHAFEHQFAGVLVLQNAMQGDRTAQCRLHRCFWSPEVEPHLKAGTFEQYARTHGIEHVDVVLEPGDLYFFNTGCIHEVPGVAGELPRIVLATFIGFTPGRETIHVWS